MPAPPLQTRAIGQPLERVDGRLKVTGAATYAHEFQLPGAAQAVLVGSTIARGTLKELDTAEAEKAPGVLKVLTHLNAPKLKSPSGGPGAMGGGIRIEQRAPLSDAIISYAGQYIAVVVARTLEQARAAARLIRARYEAQPPVLTFAAAAESARKPAQSFGEKLQETKGDPQKAFAETSLVQVDQTYSTPAETHNPMENSATTAWWESPEKLVLYDSTQHVKGVQDIAAAAFGLKRENVRVICPFVGGGFGCKGPVWPHTLLAALAAKVAGVPVKLELSRAQMFSGTGHRTPTRQRIQLAAGKDGRLQAVAQHADIATSPVGEFTEACAFGGAKVMYASPAISFSHTLHTLNTGQTSFMRAPGECPGSYAFECAIDELAAVLKMDPVALRLLNDAREHPLKGIPFSTRNLTRCYKLGAEKFGWADRKPEARSMRVGRDFIGWGVASACYPANQWNATVRMRLQDDGLVLIQCAAHDLGTGAYTALTQIAADALGLEPAKIKLELGHSDFPEGPVAGGSNTTATVGSGLVAAADVLAEKLGRLTVDDPKSSLYRANAKDLRLDAPGRLVGPDGGKGESILDILERAKVKVLEAEGTQKMSAPGKLAFHSFGAHFCEIRLDPDTCMVRVSRVVSVMDCGRVINPRTGASQILGGVVMGLGMALSEETIHDPATGLPVTRNLADYHVPVHADTAAMEVHFVGEPDLEFNSMGARGMGEIGVTGIAAAVANAVYHATGKRVRDLPITPSKLV